MQPGRCESFQVYPRSGKKLCLLVPHNALVDEQLPIIAVLEEDRPRAPKGTLVKERSNRREEAGAHEGCAEAGYIVDNRYSANMGGDFR